MIVYIVLECEAYEGGDVVFVGDTLEKAQQFIKENPLRSHIDLYDIQEWEVK